MIATMNAEITFKLLNSLALIGWLLLMLVPASKLTRHMVLRPIIPAMLAACYPVFLGAGFQSFHAGGGFGSLPAVSKLFENPMALLAGWTHYLAFDLLIGTWIVTDAQKNQIRHWAILPALGLTFFFGPTGWLVYQMECLGVKLFRNLKVSSQNEADK